MQIESVGKTHQGLVREANEDSILEMAAQGIFIVADGMGGEEAGEEASAQVIASIRRVAEDFFKTPPSAPAQVLAMLREALLEANRDVAAISEREPEKRGLGSTASVLCLHRGLYFIAHVGDSRIYLARAGTLRQLTRDHTLVWGLHERGLLARDQLETHPDRHLLTQCIGSPRPITVEMLEEKIQPGDLFLLCSDGLPGYASGEKVGTVMLDERLDLGGRADGLIDEALKAGGGDNVSVILARVAQCGPEDDWKPGTAAETESYEFSLGEATIQEEESRQAAQAQRRLSPGFLTLVGILALAILISLASLTIGTRQVKVYLRPAPAQALKGIQVRAFHDRQSLGARPLSQDAQGSYFLLPKRPGDYRVLIQVPGHRDFSDTVTLSERPSIIEFHPPPLAAPIPGLPKRP